MNKGKPATAMLSATHLGQLLLMQSILESLPDETSIRSFVSRGLADMPGVQEAMIRDVVGKPPGRSTYRFPLRVGSVSKGELLVTCHDPTAFKPYEDYIRNFCFMLSIILEERRQRQMLEAQQSVLEARVQERTHQLQGQVAELSRAEAALRASEVRYRRLFESAQDGILILDAATGMVVDVNPFLVKLLGYSHEVFLGKKIWELGFFKDVVANEDNFRELQAKDYIRYENLPLETADGRRIEVEFVSNVYLVNNQRVIQCSIRNITDRKRTEEALREKERRLSESQRIAHIGSWFYEMGNAPISWTDEMYRIYGVSPDTFTPTVENFLSLIHPDDRPAMQAWITACAAGENSGELEFRCVWPDGSLHFISGRGERMYDAQHRPTHMVGTAQDITARKQAEAELRESEQRFREIYEESPVGYQSMDAEGRLLAVNPAWLSLFGYAREEVLGRRLDEFFTPASQPAFAERFPRFREKGVAHGSEFEMQRKDGAVRVVSFDGIFVRDAQGRPAYTHCVLNDITPRKQAEAELALHASRTQALLELHQLALESPPEQVMDFALAGSLRTTQSELSFFCLLDEAEGVMTVQRWSKEVMAQCAVESQPLVFWVAEMGLLGECVRQRKPVLVNDYAAPHPGKKGLPEGHVPIRRFLSVPIFEGARIVAVAAVANKPAHYTEADSAALTSLMNKLWEILQRRQMEEMLNTKRQQLRTLIDNLPDSIYVKDTDSRFVVANAAVAKRVGVANPELLIGHTDADFHPPELARQYRADEALVLCEGQVIRNKEEQVQTATGELRWSSVTKVPLKNDAGSVIGLVGISHDITERKRSEEAQGRLVTAVEQAAEAIMITDPTGTILYANPAFEKITGYTRAETYGQTPRLLQSGKHDAEFYRQMWATLAAGQAWSGHMINKHKDGTLYEEEATISPVLDATGTIINYVATKRDVTREVALAEQNRQAAKMSAVGLLAGGVAHDFNNKLQIILGYAGIIQETLPPDHPVRSDLQEILTAAQRSADLTRQLLAFSRQQAIAPVVLDMSAVVSGSLKMLGRLVGENIRLNLEVQQELWRVFLDPGQVDQLLANLVVNARDAIASTGRVSVSAANCTLSEADCRDQPDFVPPGDYVALKISDDGSGMTPEIQARIFEPFFTTKGVGKGTGMGLATVYGIVKQNHGAITVQSALHQGTTFCIYLPRSSDDTLAAAEATAERRPTGTETILLVEDEESVLTLVQRTLTQLGYKVLTAVTPRLALHTCEQHPDEIHLLLTDVIMPDMGGKVLSDLARQIRPGMRILYMSGYTADVLEHHGHLPTNLHMLHKPFTAVALAQQVRATLDAPPAPPATR